MSEYSKFLSWFSSLSILNLLVDSFSPTTSNVMCMLMALQLLSPAWTPDSHIITALCYPSPTQPLGFVYHANPSTLLTIPDTPKACIYFRIFIITLNKGSEGLSPKYFHGLLLYFFQVLPQSPLSQWDIWLSLSPYLKFNVSSPSLSFLIHHLCFSALHFLSSIYTI